VQQSKEKGKQPFSKRILIVDNESDITQTFESALEQEYNNNKKLEVHTFNEPLSVLSQVKPSFYDLLLIDINMPDMNMHLNYFGDIKSRYQCHKC
jgi:CheY-like chemotaxis protein